MRIDLCKAVGLALICFAAGTIVQMLIPDMFIVILLSLALILAGVLLIKQ